MKIHEIELNEAIIPKVPQSLKNVGDNIKAAWNSPNAVKARDMAANIPDAARSAIYKTTGYGGKPGNIAATKSTFTSDFAQQFNMASRAARASGMPFDTTDFIKAQAQQYGWNITDEKADELALAAGNDAGKLAQGMYAIGMSQPRYKSSTGLGDIKRSRNTPSGSLGGDESEVTAGGADVDLSPQSEQIIKQIQKMRGAGNVDDVEKIAAAALGMLYTGNRQEYVKLVKRLSGLKK